MSVQTLLRQTNALYKQIGFETPITSKSAKVLGVSTAFFLGCTDDEVRILGRWKDLGTSQHYRSLDHSTLLNVFTKLSLNPEVPNNASYSSSNFASFSDRLVGLPLCCQQTILFSYQNHSCPPVPSSSNSVQPNFSSQASTLTWLVNSGWVWSNNPN